MFAYKKLSNTSNFLEISFFDEHLVDIFFSREEKIFCVEHIKFSRQGMPVEHIFLSIVSLAAFDHWLRNLEK